LLPGAPYRLFLEALAPYALRAARSHVARFLPCFLWQVFNAAASFCAFVGGGGQPVGVMEVVWRMTAPFWPTISVGIFRLVPQRL